MPFLAGENITAGRLNRLQPKTYRAKQTSAVTGAQASTDVPGASVTFTTETAGAKAVVVWHADCRNNGTGGATTVSVNAVLDGSTGSDTYAAWRGSAINEQGNVSASMDFTIAAPGSHTIKLQLQQSANNILQVYSSLVVTVYEIV